MECRDSFEAEICSEMRLLVMSVQRATVQYK